MFVAAQYLIVLNFWHLTFSTRLKTFQSKLSEKTTIRNVRFKNPKESRGTMRNPMEAVVENLRNPKDKFFALVLL